MQKGGGLGPVGGGGGGGQGGCEPTRNWLQARLTVYPPQGADQNPVNLSKNIFSALNFFMHIFNMSVTYLPCINRIY